MKKIMYITALLALSAVLAACTAGTPKSSADTNSQSGSTSQPSSKPQNSTSQSSSAPAADVKNNLSEYKFTVNGTNITLPLKFKDLEALGFVLDEKEKPENVDPNGMPPTYKVISNGYPVYVDLEYKGTEPIDYKEAYVTCFSSYETLADDCNYAKVSLPNGAELWETSIDEAKKIYGEPSKESSNASENCLIYNLDNGRYQFDFSNEDDKLRGFTIRVDCPAQ